MRESAQRKRYFETGFNAFWNAIAPSRTSACASFSFVSVFDNDPGRPQSGTTPPVRPDAAHAVAMTAAWVYVRGLALLMIDGHLAWLAGATKGVREAEQARRRRYQLHADCLRNDDTVDLHGNLPPNGLLAS